MTVQYRQLASDPLEHQYLVVHSVEYAYEFGGLCLYASYAVPVAGTGAPGAPEVWTSQRQAVPSQAVLKADIL